MDKHEAGPELDRADWAEAKYAELTASVQPLLDRQIEANRAIARLREMLAVCYAGAALYADDGELQDGRTHPVIDFKRDSVDDIHRKMVLRGAAATKGVETPPPDAGGR